MQGASVTEKPLNPGAKAALMAGATATILFYYLLSLVAIALLAVLIAFLLLILLVALRFGASGAIMPYLSRHVDLMGLIFRSFWLSSSNIEFRLPLQEKDAPELFAIVRDQAQKLQVNPPDVIQLEMGLSAWVNMKGLRKGKGKTILGIGYDLLAGLSKPEMEGVLAHELTHAKLVQRGLSGWLNSGLIRLGKFTGLVGATAEAYKRKDEHFIFAELCEKVGDRLSRLAARQIRAYSRQDEFEADHGAAELCGAIKIRSSLEKLESLGEITEQLPWKERVARLQLEGGYSRWLRQELAKAATLPPKPQTQLLHQYSTHPILKDRLAALPDDGSTLPAHPEPAIDLLANPDEVADKLVVAIQKSQALVEAEDSKELQKWSRKVRGGGKMYPLQGLGFFLGIVSLLMFGFILVEPKNAVLWFGAISFMVLAVILFKIGGYKDKQPLPVLSYGSFITGWRKLDELKDIQEIEKQEEASCKALIKDVRRKKDRVKALTKEAYAALGRSNYLRAHVAARLTLNEDGESVEAVMAYTIAAAALNLGDQVGRTLPQLKHLTGLKSPQTLWGAGWALTMVGDWPHAEAFLEQAVAGEPENAAKRMLLAFTQARRGKLQNAIKNAREAIAIRPEDLEANKLFINLLLESGFFREAQERLNICGAKVAEDTDLMLAQVRVHLVQQDIAKADEWAEQLKDKAPHAQMIIRLGESYEEARQHDQAVGCYNRALEKGYYPAAFVGMGRIEAMRQNVPVARTYFLSALDLQKNLGEKAIGPLGLFHEVVGRLVMLHEPVQRCQAWVASLTSSASPEELRNQSFLVYAESRPLAEGYFNLLMESMRKGQPPLMPGALVWKEAAKELQPDGPVRPGVQSVLG